MNAAEKITQIIQYSDLLQGEPLTHSGIGRIIGSDASTVHRWSESGSNPRRKELSRINMLLNILQKAIQKNEDALRIYSTIRSNPNIPILSWGEHGVAIANGMAWLFCKQKVG